MSGNTEVDVSGPQAAGSEFIQKIIDLIDGRCFYKLWDVDTFSDGENIFFHLQNISVSGIVVIGSDKVILYHGGRSVFVRLGKESLWLMNLVIIEPKNQWLEVLQNFVDVLYSQVKREKQKQVFVSERTK
jgi:hypothetical protein